MTLVRAFTIWREFHANSRIAAWYRGIGMVDLANNHQVIADIWAPHAEEAREILGIAKP